MVTNNKVLTVSYGTFSCTLEGFDDSFDTMKSIAEYFRDLAADDRYFGAEPPTPDAEMLARIAEREIARQVVARQDDGTIHLRAAEQEAASASEAAPAPAAMAPAAPAMTPAPQPEVAAQPEPVTEPTEPVVEVAAEPEVIEAAPVAEPVADAAPAPATSEDDSVANKLQRIRAVVSRNAETAAPIEEAFEGEAGAVAEDDYLEDEHAEEMAAAPEEVAVEAVEEPEAPESLIETASPDADDLADMTAEGDVDPAVLAAIAELNAPEAAEETAEVEAEEPVETRIEVSEEIADEAEDDFDAILAAVRDAETAPEAEADVEITEEAPALETPVEDQPEVAEEVTEGAVEEEAAPVRPARPVRPVRVMKMKRADYEAGLLTDAPPETPIQQETPEAIETADPAALSAEEEADLLRELSDVEEDFAEDTATELEADEVRSIFAEEAEEADVSRLMDKTVSEMDNPEGTHRRNAIAHLRAAVQANRAEADAGGVLNSRETGSHAYRADLNDVVRPTRADAVKSSDAAPLKLVAEQRVDAPAAAVDTPVAEATPAVAPVRPRRVRRVIPAATAEPVEAPMEAPVAAPVASPAAHGSFAEFAETVGAQELPELLEAAASYLSHVEGLDQFSRPQLMKKARQADNMSFSREDGLRSFGQLLRDGKIEKLQGGRFTVSDQIGFRAEARDAG